jgi:flagellar basal-body rod modification protein FlgD
LTTQLAHQDPTAPQDNAQMIAQLAQFSSLEQLTEISKKLDAIGTAFGIPSTGASSTERTR